MTLGRTACGLAFGLVTLLAGCGGGGDSSSSSNMVSAVLQDLGLDPDGMTTVVSFTRAPAGVVAASFDSNGPQNAVSATANGNDVVVTWDERVTPSDRVRVVGVSGVASNFVDVTTSDASAPSLAITGATQVVGLGDDTITVQFSGPRVVESEAEDLDNWTLEVGGQTLDLSGSTFSLVPATQVLTITTGSLANLHASFDLTAASVHSVADVPVPATAVAGAAVGDTTAPALVSLEQNLAEDEFGRVVDVTFSEAMDPVFATSLANFVMGAPDIATSVEQPSEEVLRVTFNNPVVPGINSIQLTNLMDAHGNAFPTGVVPIAAGSTVANAFASGPELVTVDNAGGDFLQMEFDQAIDPDGADDPTRWVLQLDPPLGAIVDLSGATFTYDLASKSLLISLVDDYANGQVFGFGPNGANAPVDVDGEDFAATVTDQAAGDVSLPSVTLVVQNRNQDSSGLTLDVTFSEDVDEASAELAANWSATGANVVSATRLAGLETVRVVLDALAVPGSATLSAASVTDLAGNAMANQAGIAITSTDTTAPSATLAAASAIEGAANDTMVVTFDDDMIESEVESQGAWIVESPAGFALDTSLASVSYNAASRVATMTFADLAGPDLQRGDDFVVAFAGARDVAGNAIGSADVNGNVVSEIRLPAVDSVWVETAFQNTVHVRFDEPCDLMDDLAGWTQYTVRNSIGVLKGPPVSAIEDADRMGVELVFGFVVLAGSDTLDVQGVTDLAGNALFPELARAVELEDASTVDVDDPNVVATTVTGEENDHIVVPFDRRPSPWGLLDPANWSVTENGNPVDLAAAELVFDGNQTVTIRLDGVGAPDLATGSNCDVSVSGLMSAQGVAMGAPAGASVATVGDSTAADLPAGKARLDAADLANSVLLEMDEAISSMDAADVSKVTLNGTTNPDSAVQLGQRTVRATFSGGVAVADTVEVDFRDLAGNSAVATRAITAQDGAGPLVVSVAGSSVVGAGGDAIAVDFDEPLEPNSALTPANYTITNGAQSVDLTGATLRYTSANHRVTIFLAAGVELSPAAALSVGVANVYNHSGLVMNPPANVGGAVTGDTTAPDFAAAFANYRQDASGTVLDVRFDEDVDASFALVPTNWSASGGPSVSEVESLDGHVFRVTLSAPLAPGASLSLVGLPDLAGNVSGAVAIQPTL